MTKLLALATVLTLTSACAGQERRQNEMYEHLRTCAAFDMECDRTQVELTPLGDNTVGVNACGQRATYVGTMCTGEYYVSSCTWIMNSESRPQTQE